MPLGTRPTNVANFLRFVTEAMLNRGFGDYVSPRSHMEVNRNGVPHGRRWSLQWGEPRHSL
eukprot:15422123-Alexandrium_andersonii.AAC.1